MIGLALAREDQVGMKEMWHVVGAFAWLARFAWRAHRDKEPMFIR